MKRSVFLVLIVLLLAQLACVESVPVSNTTSNTQPQNLEVIGVMGVMALVPAGTTSFSINTEAVTGGVQLWAPTVGVLTNIGPAGLAALVAGYFSITNQVQQAVEGSMVIRLDGLEYTVDRTTKQVTVRVLDWQEAKESAIQMALEQDTALPQEAAVNRSVNAEAEGARQPEQKSARGGATIVVADDDPVDLVSMATASKIIMETLGFGPITVVSCLNDFNCIYQGALFGGFENGQARAIFLDGGFVGMPVPPSINGISPRHPPVKARTIPGKDFFSGPWIATYLRDLGYRGSVIYVSTEGWSTIGQYKGQGADLGPTFTKDWYFITPERFAGRVGDFIP